MNYPKLARKGCARRLSSGRRRWLRLTATVVLSGAAFSLLNGALHAAVTVDYNRDIRPIISENCFRCHGPDEKARKSKRRLDQPEGAYADHDGVIAIKPGRLDESEVWSRITSDADDEDLMPPLKSHLSLTAGDKAKIKAWIEQGAKYEKQWSLIPPRKAEVPAGGQNSPIDAFVRARLAENGLKPAPEADRATLIRRVSLDLSGLPPSAGEVEAFVADRDPKAYEKLVDRLLRSEHYGERMALEWLDASRYADTNGFSIDGGRNQWLWRDWVIQAFNDNLPYDRFLVDQVAGDLLPHPTVGQLIATGFQRNNMVTHEGGTIPAENLTNYNVDRVKTLGEAVLGLTLGCAQCHDHKFDPITQKDYYRMFAFFNTLSDKGLDGNAGVNAGPRIMARTVLRSVGEESELRGQIAALDAEFARINPELLARWEKRERGMLAARGKSLNLHPVNVLKISTPNKGEGFDREGENRVRLTRPPTLGAYDILMELPKAGPPITGLRVVMHPLPELPGGGWGSGPVGPKAARPPPSEQTDDAEGATGGGAPAKGSFMLTEIAATADSVPGDQINLFKLKAISRVTANSWDPAHPPAACLDGRNDNGWSPALATSGPVRFTLTFAEPVHAEATRFLTVELNFGHGQSLIPGLIEFLAMSGTDDDTDLPPDIVAALGTPARRRPGEMQAALWRYCAAHAAEWEAKRVARTNLKERLAVLTKPYSAMVMDVAAKPRPTFILNRGDYAQPTVKVDPGTPAFLPPMPAGAPPDRLGLAQWITMKENPLTARVEVNRVWKMLFGTGIVATPADFGVQGEWPSHPELLDWLAVDFVERGWDVKALVRQIVLSKTFRQSALATPAMLERDPANRLLARGPRFRLEAEFVRDGALKISGLLVPRIGGPSVNPYTPGDLWREISHYGSTPATAQTFVQDHGEKLYRRSLYTYWKRTVPPPNLAAFDAPSREVCTVARQNTVTPMQALVMLNDTQFVEASRAFAERILARPGNDRAKLRWAFLETTSREPQPAEASVLQAALRRERARYAAQPALAGRYLGIGESFRNPKIPLPEHAAWAQVAVILLNLSETVTCD